MAAYDAGSALFPMSVAPDVRSVFLERELSWPTRSTGAARTRSPSGWASFLEILILAPLAAVVVLGVVPSVFEIEWECVRGYGVVRTVGDSYLTGFAVVGAMGWIVVLAAMIFAHISERPRVAMALPVTWFAVLVGASLVVGAAIGPATCGP